MDNLFIDCSSGVSGDMLLAALLDIGVPLKIVKEALDQSGISNKCLISIKDSESNGFRGKRFLAKSLGNDSIKPSWIGIKQLITESNLKEEVKTNALNVFNILANAEASVHGTNIEDVHFHEIGSIDTIVDIIGVCSALEYLKPNNIFSTYPPSGSGSVKTAHGELQVPVPVVLELAKDHQISLSGTTDSNVGELTTPSGLALIIVFSDYFFQPESFLIKSIGVGLGSRSLNKPNFLRVCLLEDNKKLILDKSSKGIIRSSVISQEAWIDDSSAEDLAFLMDQLRNNGAIEVVSEPIQMKKGRNGTSIKALVLPEIADKLRFVWLSNGSTIGIRERVEERWILERRRGTCETSFGKVLAKQVKRPDGRYTLKPEFEDVSRLSTETGLSVEQIRNEISSKSNTFTSDEDWRC